MSIANQVETYLRHLRVERGASKNTIAAYRRDLDRYERFLTDRGVTALEGIDELTVTDFFNRADQPLGHGCHQRGARA